MRLIDLFDECTYCTYAIYISNWFKSLTGRLLLLLYFMLCVSTTCDAHYCWCGQWLLVACAGHYNWQSRYLQTDLTLDAYGPPGPYPITQPLTAFHSDRFPRSIVCLIHGEPRQSLGCCIDLVYLLSKQTSFENAAGQSETSIRRFGLPAYLCLHSLSLPLSYVLIGHR